LLTGREYFFDHFSTPDAHFFCRCRRATPVKLDLSGFPDHRSSWASHVEWRLWAEKILGKNTLRGLQQANRRRASPKSSGIEEALTKANSEFAVLLV
jgi:hypothetical protein